MAEPRPDDPSRDSPEVPRGVWAEDERLAAVPAPPRKPSLRARMFVYEYTGTQKHMRWLGIGLTVLGLALSGLLGWAVPLDLLITVSGEKTRGTVTTAKVNQHISVNEQHPTTITFRYEVDGAVLEGECSTRNESIVAQATPGQTMPVEVATMSPSLARIEGTTMALLGNTGLIFFCLPIVGIFFMRRASRIRRRRVRAFEQGKPVLATVTFRGQIGNPDAVRPPYEVRWTFPANGTVYQGSLSHTNGMSLVNVISNDTIVVLHDEKNPTMNTVWIA